jgi:hypothetical protein
MAADWFGLGVEPSAGGADIAIFGVPYDASVFLSTADENTGRVGRVTHPGLEPVEDGELEL